MSLLNLKREPLFCKFICFLPAAILNICFALSFQVCWVQVYKVLTYLVRTSQSPVGWPSSAGRLLATWLWALPSVSAGFASSARYVSPSPDLFYEFRLVIVSLNRVLSWQLCQIWTSRKPGFVTPFLSVQQLSQQPLFVPGVWGPCLSAMVPELWLNEGGQSATGRLVRLEVTSALGKNLPACLSAVLVQKQS